MEDRNQVPGALLRVIDQHVLSATRKACDARQRLGSAYLETHDQNGFNRTIDAAQAALEEAESELTDWQAVKSAIAGCGVETDK